MNAQPGMFLTHIIMEHCDRGSLLGAIQRGVFRIGGACMVLGVVLNVTLNRACRRVLRLIGRSPMCFHPIIRQASDKLP